MCERLRRGRWLGLGLLTLLACGEPGSLSPQGDVAEEIGDLTMLLVIAGTAVFVIVLVALGLAVRPGRDQSDDLDSRRSRRLVLGGGVVLPVVVLVPLTVVMVLAGADLGDRREEVDLEIEVVGHQFWWEVRYPEHEVVTANEIRIPADTPIRLLLRSEDVIHSFWAPQVAGKIDLIPGKTNELTFSVEEAGTYQGFCAEFCGLQHGRMRFLLIAESEAAFEDWLAEQAEPAADPVGDAEAAGREVFFEYGCAACHTVRGAGADGDVGPDLTHLASRRTLGAGTVPNRRGHLAGWVVDPQSVKPGNLMPPTPLSGEDLSALLAYLEGLE